MLQSGPLMRYKRHLGVRSGGGYMAIPSTQILGRKQPLMTSLQLELAQSVNDNLKTYHDSEIVLITCQPLLG